MTHQAFVNKINDFTKKNIPFLFLVDFEKKNPIVFALDEAEKQGFLFSVKGITNSVSKEEFSSQVQLIPTHLNRDEYHQGYMRVLAALQHGDSFLLNLTYPTKIELNCSLEEVYHRAKAPYKLYKENDFTVFSPECFIKIHEGYIYTYPMKGTIDAQLPNPRESLLKNPKEQFEHNTIVDLMRNDLSIVAKEVEVTKFRYSERLQTTHRDLLQTSSEIRGKLLPNWKANLGELLLSLLPAGSISGAPKEKTCTIIKVAEKKERGYFTGVFGVFDGKNLDSGVMIRYIEQNNKHLYFRSGGGITALSNEEDEYHELLQKVYIPIF